MAQKPLFKSGKGKPSKVPAANKHGRVQKVQKGKLQRPAKSAAAQKADNERQEITKVINRRIEEETAAAALHNGRKLSMVKPNASHGQEQKGSKKLKGQPK